jgi:cell wall-associated NlpC family hydrolase
MRALAMWLLAGALSACASAPTSPPKAVGKQAATQAPADHALRMVGTPYRYGGASPAGFDCSGLVQFSFRQAGVSVPRSTEEQRRVSRPIKASGLRPGDLLFFDQEGKKNSHVGIYVGDGAFVHAPSSGGRVRKDRIDSPYWRKHLSETRRFS